MYDIKNHIVTLVQFGDECTQVIGSAAITTVEIGRLIYIEALSRDEEDRAKQLYLYYNKFRLTIFKLLADNRASILNEISDTVSKLEVKEQLNQITFRATRQRVLCIMSEFSPKLSILTTQFKDTMDAFK